MGICVAGCPLLNSRAYQKFPEKILKLIRFFSVRSAPEETFFIDVKNMVIVHSLASPLSYATYFGKNAEQRGKCRLFDIREQIVPVRAVVAKWMIAKTKYTTFSPISRHCGKEAETIDHISADCKKLNFADHKKRHEQLATSLVHHAICKKIGAECDRRAWMRKPAMRMTVGARTPSSGIHASWTLRMSKAPQNSPDLI